MSFFCSQAFCKLLLLNLNLSTKLGDLIVSHLDKVEEKEGSLSNVNLFSRTKGSVPN